MRERIYRIGAVLCYLWLIAYLTGSPQMILDVRGLLAVALGLALLSLPQLVDRKSRKAKGAAAEFWNVIASNGMMSGYLTTVLFLTIHLMGAEGVESIPMLLGENLRPLLYGLCIYTVFHVKETPAAEKPALPEKREPDNDALYLHFQQLGLTNRETELAILAYRGYSNREIAEMCYISEATVKKHMTHIFEKLGVDGREELKSRSIIS